VAAHGAHSLTLRPLDTDEARELLIRRLGAERVAAEQEAAAEITALCAGLPLALVCVAARAAAHPHFSLSAIAAELREAQGSLDAFIRADESADVGAVFSWSSRALSPAAARLFRLLGLHPGPDFTAPAAAALAGLAVIGAATSSGSHRLVCLLVSSMERFFDRQGRWHDWAAAQRTALDAALRLSDPVLEAHSLRGLARVEGQLGLRGEASAHLDRALGLFTELGDDVGRAYVHLNLGWEAEQRGDLPSALLHDQLALDLFRATGRQAAQATALNAVGWDHAMLGDHQQALGHCLEALAIQRDLGDHPQALTSYRNALTIYRDLGVPAEEAGTLVRIGDTHRATGDHEAAAPPGRAPSPSSPNSPTPTPSRSVPGSRNWANRKVTRDDHETRDPPAALTARRPATVSLPLHGNEKRGN
jgi:tetratricopeptide (TPR) repeat protein